MIDIKTVEHIAKLSRLELTAEEKLREQQDLTQILGYMDKLNELDTTDVAATFAVPKLVGELRADIVRESMDNDSLLSNAPDSDDGAYRVPNVVE